MAADLASLHAAVLENPDSDAPRLAYADAVARTDPARADLIRMQLEISRMRRDEANPAILDGRVRTLLKKHKDAWAKDLAGVRGVKWIGFERGFPEHVHMSARDFVDHGAGLFARARIRHLDLLEVKPHAAELFRSPLLGRIHTLWLWRADVGDDEVLALAASPHLGNLRWLDLSGNRISEAGLEALAASTNLPALQVLFFADNLVPDPTPQVGESDWNGAASWRYVTPTAQGLEARFDRKPWLSSLRLDPPARDEV
jgi:uncharacterized protein (TIGR02996 family)